MIVVPGFRDRPIGVMGLGRSGLSAARALLASGAEVRAWDDGAESRTAAAAAGIPVVDLRTPGALEGVDTLVLSPGIPDRFPQPHPVAAQAKEAGCSIVCDVDLLGRAQPDAGFIGITGTNGKSTTTALVGHILATAGRTVEVGGNLGPPVLDMAPLGGDGTYVLELSSYQLERTGSIVFDVAVLLNVSADHLDRHGGMAGYIAAKRRIFDGQRERHTAVVGIDERDGRAILESLRAGGRMRIIPISGQTAVEGGVHAAGGLLSDARTDEPRIILDLNGCGTLPGSHNWQNAAAATAVALAAGIGYDDIAAAMRSYPGLPHRQEIVAEIGGVTYVNDSKATNADAAEKALRCYRRVHWIAGGVAKEDGIEPLRPLFGRIAHAYLIGESTPRFARTLGEDVSHSECGDLAAALAAAHAAAQRAPSPGAVVLLSPAAASFDQFRNFEARGDLFRHLAQALATGRLSPGGRA